MMGLARFGLKKMQNLEFWKLFGSGTGEGFTPIPNFSVYGILCVWESETAARNALLNEELFKKYMSRASHKSTIGADKNVMFKIGLGEVPIRQQLTFSIWKNLSHMKKFAHQTGSHKDAILKVREGNWFSEELYARFNVIEVKGNFSEFNQKETGTN